MNVYQWITFDFEEVWILKISEFTNEYANSWVNISQIILLPFYYKIEKIDIEKIVLHKLYIIGCNINLTGKIDMKTIVPSYSIMVCITWWLTSKF